jgi:hypothetical protein
MPFTSNESVYHLDSLANKAAAFCRVSRSIFCSAFSALSRASSLSSLEVGRCSGANVHIATWALDELARALKAHYPATDPETNRLVPPSYL